MERKVSKSNLRKEKTNLKRRVRFNKQVHSPIKQEKFANSIELIKSIKTSTNLLTLNPIIKKNKIKL